MRKQDSLHGAIFASGCNLNYRHCCTWGIIYRNVVHSHECFAPRSIGWGMDFEFEAVMSPFWGYGSRSGGQMFLHLTQKRENQARLFVLFLDKLFRFYITILGM